jgi:UDP-glucose 4-epimerase
MRIVVAGGRGFIGGHVQTILRDGGDDVLACGREGVAAMAGFRPEAVVWAAGGREGRHPIDEPHVLAPVAALESCLPTGALRRFVYLSSGAVYGSQEVPFREQDEPRPQTPYGRAKLEGERRLGEAAAGSGVALTVLRAAVVYGPGQAGPMFVPAVLDALRARRRCPLTPGAQTRDFLFVLDLGELVRRCLRPDAPAGIYNAGTGREIVLADAARAIARAVGEGSEALLDFGVLPYRQHEQMRYVLDPRRARDAFVWTAGTAFEEGVRLTAQTPTRQEPRSP